ncbi:MAG: glycoside hydrolase family 43 protein [Eubacteriales bacterium]
MLTANDIVIRDPFILPVPEEKAYYLYGTVGKTEIDGRSVWHFAAFRTTDLVHFEEPAVVFHEQAGFWADRDYWAPEVHRYRGRYYMFASFKAEGVCRGTQILVSDKPDGMFVPLTAEPVTPRDRECLDGTLWVENGKPYIIFCHEWVQIHDGTVCVMPLTDDLTAAAGEPVTLFSASCAAWAPRGKKDYVTDGPFVFRMKDGTLAMLWSSFLDGTGYAQVLALSQSGSVMGPWLQKETPVFTSDGGHGMLFDTFEGQRMLTLHAPNHHPEHPCFFPVGEENGTLVIGQ